MKTTLIFFLSACTCLAQNFAVLTHGAANTLEFISGCPSNWPVCIQPIGNATKLPASFKSPWVFATQAQIDEWLSTNAVSKEAWNKAREAEADQPKRDREAVIRQAIDDLKTIRDSNGTLTALQLSNAVRAIAKALVAVIEESRP